MLDKQGATPQKLYKRWKEIADIHNQWIRMALTTLSTGSAAGKETAEQFPQYFSDQPIGDDDPISLNAFLSWANEEVERCWEPGTVGSGCHSPVSVAGADHHFHIPIFSFCWYEPDNFLGHHIPVSQDQMKEDGFHRGDVITWSRMRFIVLEVDTDHSVLHTASVERVVPSLADEWCNPGFLFP